jgi:hypothetical protein
MCYRCSEPAQASAFVRPRLDYGATGLRVRSLAFGEKQKIEQKDAKIAKMDLNSSVVQTQAESRLSIFFIAPLLRQGFGATGFCDLLFIFRLSVPARSQRSMSASGASEGSD